MRWRASILPLLAAGVLLTGEESAPGGSSAGDGAGAREARADESPVAPKRVARESVASEAPARESGPPAAGTPAHAAAEDARGAPRRLFTGLVVPLAEALKRRKISASDEELKGQVVLETPAGELIPIVPDWRGRAFFQDERLRERKVELVGYRPPGTPYLKILMVFTFDEQGARQYTDYWCDICSIPMYEIQRCECCQGPVRLRFQPRDLPDYVSTDASRESPDAPERPNPGEPRRPGERGGRKEQPRAHP